jgi:hypothetical protein
MSDKDEKGLKTRCIRSMVKSGMKGREALRLAVSLSESSDKREEELKGDGNDSKKRGNKKKWKER